MPAVLIASPTELLRRRWRRELGRKYTVDEVAQRAALVRSMASQKPALLLLDLALRRFNGLEDFAAIQRLSPRTKVILLTGAPDLKEEISALKAGAKGYCDRDIAPSLLAKAVERVQKGEIWVGRRAISNFIEELAAVTYRQEEEAPLKRLERLTARERDVAHLVGAGARNKEIAAQLKVAEKTVKAHITAIFRKLRLSNRAQLALFVAEQRRVSS